MLVNLLMLLLLLLVVAGHDDERLLRRQNPPRQGSGLEWRVAQNSSINNSKAKMKGGTCPSDRRQSSDFDIPLVSLLRD